MAAAQVLNTLLVSPLNDQHVTDYTQDGPILREYEMKNPKYKSSKGEKKNILEEAARSGNAQLLQDVLDDILKSYQEPKRNKKSGKQRVTSHRFGFSTSVSPCKELPKEIWMEIIKLLAAQELCVMCQLSKQFSVLASNEKLWKNHFPQMIPTFQPSYASFKIFCLETIKKRRNMLKLDNFDWDEWSNPKHINANSSEYDCLLKFLMIGDAGSGKSSILLRFADQTFTDNYITTIGVDFKIKTVGFQGKVLKLQCWDTSGQERFRTITSSYYRGTMGILIVFDLTDRNSFDHVRDHWQNEIQRYAREDVKVVIVGNKLDLEARRQVTKEEALAFAESINAPYGEVSAKTGENVELAFASLVNQSVPLALTRDDVARPSLPPPRKSACCNIL